MYELAVFLVVIAAIWNAVVLYARLTAWAVRRTQLVSRLIAQAAASSAPNDRVRP